LIRLFASTLLIAFMVALTLDVVPSGAVRQFENWLYDARVRLTAPGGQDPRIIVIALDEKSLSAEGQWPWTRDKLAVMTQRLYDYGVRVVGFDVVFPERDMSHDLETLRLLGADDAEFMGKLEALAPGLDRDQVFGEALAQGQAVLAYYFNTDIADSMDEEGVYELGELPLAAFDVDDTMSDRMFLPQAEGFTSNVPELMTGAWSAGFISNPLIDPDGIVRRTPLLHRYGNSAYESLALAMAATVLNDIALPVFVDAPLLVEGYPPLEAVEIGGQRIPLDAQGAVLVPYRGGAGSFRYVSATDVIRGTLRNPERLAGTIAIVGATAPGLQDLRSTPFGSIYPGVEIHANVLAGILDGNFRWQPAYTRAAEMVAVIGFGLLVALTLPLLSAIWATVMMLAALAIALWLNLYLFTSQMHVLPLAATLLVIFGVYMINLVIGYFFESRSRTYMNELFGQYVPPDLVTEMALDPSNYSMESEKRDLSVLFTDIRGFTTLSEKLDAQELSDLLNRFLTPMTEVVHDTKGTIDKYMGDCVMAFWGAPVPNENHAAAAVRAGLGMLRALEDLNMKLWKEGQPELAIGVGVNTGTMSVGNMGSRFRRAYTVLGDAVNLGSRLEGLTKAYGVNFIVSSFTVDEAPEFVYREIDRVRVKGKLLPVIIYEVVGEQGMVPDEEMARLKQWEQCLKLYRTQHWNQARQVLKNLREQDPQRLLYQLYLQRIDAFMEDPPGDDWDGVFTHQSK
jgi:adenylate cyclase